MALREEVPLADWMVYASMVSLLLWAGARLLEDPLRARGLPGRWVWALALAGSVAIPAAAWTTRAAPAVSAASAPSPAGPTLDQVGAPGVLTGSSEATPAPPARALRVPAPPALPAALDPFAAAGWLLLSLALADTVGRAAVMLARRRAGWEPARALGRHVLLSEGVGPAVVGVLRPAIVLPRRTLGASPAELDLIVRHEEEHLRAGDTRLLALALVALLLVPWNLPAWWQLRRLRLALEMDCDRRVLGRSGASPTTYARLLLAMSRTPPGPAGALPLAHPRPFLERRIHTMLTPSTSHPARTLVLALLSLSLMAAAWRVEEPAPRPAGDVTTGENAEAGFVGALTPFAPAAATAAPADPVLSEDAPSLAALPAPPPPVSATWALAPFPAGRVSGRLTDTNGTPIADALVRVIGTTSAAISNASGSYAIGDVPAGSYELRVERVGFAAASRQIDVGEDSAIEVHFVLALLGATASAPAVLPPGVPSPPNNITIRGVNSIDGSAAPIIFVDGVRITPQPPGPDGEPAPSPLDQFRPEQIERIEVLRGSAASALYGEEAARGVIQIFLKPRP